MATKDILLALTTLTTDKLDIIRLKLWKRLEGDLQAIKTKYGHDVDDLFRGMIEELIEGKKHCPEEKAEPSACLLALVEDRVNDFRKGLKTQQHPQKIQTEVWVNIDDIPIEKIREELRALGSKIEPFHEWTANKLGVPKLLSEYWKKRILEIFWIPEGAGLRQTSSGFFEKKHAFAIGDDEVRITCSWGEQKEDEPAYLWLSWNAQISPEKELWILFLDPETQGIRYEVNLGTKLTGETTFTGNELKFDPSSEKWAISIMLQEMEQ